MSTSLDPTLANLNDCGCCEGISPETPQPVFNRPGLTAIAYRAGTHSEFKETMLARLSTSHQPALQPLNTRDDSDFSIALLDAWATVCDVLTFYQERTANEKYLRTATEQFSVVELARLIGYQLRPGVAATGWLAFTLEDAPGAFGQAVNLSNVAQAVQEVPPPVTIDAGVKVQSVPDPGDEAATFETVEAIEARAEWNSLKPRLHQPQLLSATMGSIVFEGTATNLKIGDKLLIDISSASRVVRTILNVTADDDSKTTRIDFENPALSPASFQRPSQFQGKPGDFTAGTPLDETTVQMILAKWWTEEDLAALAKMQNWSVPALAANINKTVAAVRFKGGSGVFAFRQRAALFGNNAPREPAYEARGTPKPYAQWTEWPPETDEAPGTLFLDAAYDAILAGSYIAVRKPAQAETVFVVNQAITRSRAAYGMSAKTTVVTLAGGSQWWNPKPNGTEDFAVIRGTSVLAQSEQLTLTEIPVEDVVTGHTLTLARAFLGLKKGQKVILTGERDDLKGVSASELLTIKESLLEAGFTVLVFETELNNPYVRSTVTLNGNVAEATHGETVQETLGSGDATEPFQRFTLKQPPLTYTAAVTPTGAETTLEVRVDDLLWDEVPDLFGRGSAERVYMTRTDDEGKTTVQFGDGKTGARLPTGAENVKAKYRRGIGLDGLVREHKLSQLMSRPLGVEGVTNPLAATGAQDREQLAETRRNAPLTILTLGRVVSLQDYEDFARAFSGIAKALASWSWSGERRTVLVTVAAVNGEPVAQDLRETLLTSLREFGDPNAAIEVSSYQPRFFRLAATLRVADDYLPENVRADVETQLRERFSFDAREFGQPVHQSEVIGLIQNVRGVVSTTVTEFYRSDETTDVHPRLPAARPQLGGDQLVAAELLTLDPSPLQLGVVQ
jgi:predicted phage baseplate assembly protein